MKINNFQGALTDISAKKEALDVTWRLHMAPKDGQCLNVKTYGICDKSFQDLFCKVNLDVLQNDQGRARSIVCNLLDPWNTILNLLGQKHILSRPKYPKT